MVAPLSYIQAGLSGDQEGESHEIIASTARRAVGEQARSADKGTCVGIELPGADSSAAGSPSSEVSPNYDFNECWLTGIDTGEINKNQAVERCLEFLEKEKLDK